ncbi:MAG: GAF domain-containing protein [Chloroflexi bacterium]|nr:GAF domain-containing protein [Chloroflexota bacterium]
MLTAADLAFVGEIESLGTRDMPVEDFFAEVVTRIRAHRPAWHWVGVYLLVGDTLRLGPYVGAPTEHTSIAVGVGVCGTAVARDANIVVDDVRTLDNYLACSLGTRSELVVLIRDQGEVVGQFDVDSDNVAEFGAEDVQFLEQLASTTAARARALREGMSGQSVILDRE